ncbi:MAG: uroporphyrinogen-III C-methyltransferase [Acidobacteriaceae bacterium]|nr:uroporphyrinogen-III C-methyltransferase [Acidobacteriaceae bacterium]
MKGKVYLVGAGPGDPDLLTVKTVRLLKSAEVVLYDDLVSEEILALVSRNAQMHNVGKRCGQKKISQAEINFLLIALAESGLNVVRLKSGDPLIFGRGGEESEALRKAGVEFEIVPGVTAVLGAAAAAQIPLTHRDVSHALVLLTGQAAEGRDSVDWEKLVASRATLAVYMPGNDYRALTRRLMEAGLAEATPCAVISAASRRDQQIAVANLGMLADGQHFPAPALLIVGEVVRLAPISQDRHFSTKGISAAALASAIPGLIERVADGEVA